MGWRGQEPGSISTPQSARKNARDVVGESTAGDVGGAFEELGFMESLDRLQIGSVNAEQFAGELLRLAAGVFEQELANQGIAVGVESIRG